MNDLEKLSKEELVAQIRWINMPQLETELLRRLSRVQELENYIVEQGSIFESIEDILDGKEVSDFMQSFPLVARVDLLMCEFNGKDEAIKQHTEEIKELEKENDTLRETLLDIVHNSTVHICSFCGERFEPPSFEALTAHMKVCAKHPMRELQVRLITANRAVEAMEKIGTRLTEWADDEMDMKTCIEYIEGILAEYKEGK